MKVGILGTGAFGISLASVLDRNNVDIIIMGHTHESGEYDFNGIKIVNPGSIALPRDFRHTYMIISDKIYIKDLDQNILKEVSI